MGAGVRFSVAVDTGGTFTDTAVMDEHGHVTVHKAPTTPSSPIVGVLASLSTAAADRECSLDELLDSTDLFVYGTTFATNTIIQRTRDGKTGLLTTKGFGDTLAIRRMMRRSTFDIQEPYPLPLVPRRLVRELDERLAATGDVVTAVREQEALEAATELIDAGCDSLAVCFLHSHANPDHERIVRDVIKERWPDLYVTISSEVAPEVREFERTSTTVMNAYVGPAVSEHFAGVQRGLKERGLRAPLLVMQSNGGVAGVEDVDRNPVYSVFSGPAGGMTAGAHLGGLTGAPNVITLDMGGTSFDVGLVKQGEIATAPHGQVAGWPLLGKRFDLSSIGAGGGSIAWVDENQLIRVGPASAGADPGPACYQRGGRRPTVTDADLVLGYINPDQFAGRGMKLSRELAEETIQREICEKTGTSLAEAANGIYQIVNAKMVDAIRLVTVAQGHDPREFSALAFGGAGPLHAAAIHAELGTRQLIIPALATGLSALGLLLSDVRHSLTRALRMRLDDFDLDRANELIAEMDEEAVSMLMRGGVDEAAIVVEVAADACYRGQLHELTVPLPYRRLDSEALGALRTGFEQLYDKHYGFHEPEAAVELVALRVDGVGLVPHPDIAKRAGGEDASQAVTEMRQVSFWLEDGYVETPIFDGSRTAPGMRFQGPAIIEYPGTNVVLPPGHSAQCDEWMNMIVSV